MHHRSSCVGILTLHYGFNEGAVLQAYSLAALLKRRLAPAEVEIVDQRYPSKLAVGGPAADPRTRAIQQAIDEWLPLGPVRSRTNDSAAVKATLPGRYDLLVYGSDQIWCLHYQRRLRSILGRGIFPVQNSPFLPPYPNVYWPDERLAVPQVTFAAAVGRLKWEDIPKRHAAAMRRGLSACRLISARDDRTFRFIEWLGADLAARTSLVPDPTFAETFRTQLADTAARERLRERLTDLGVDFSRPRCGIVSGRNPAVAKIAEELRRSGVQTIGITAANDCCEVRLFEEGFHPMDWARLFGFMDYCISERMHACICCLLQQTPFVALDINVVSGDSDTKVRGLLQTFGLEEYCMTDKGARPEELREKCRAVASNPWDWESIVRTVDRLAKTQLDFLDRIPTAIAAA